MTEGREDGGAKFCEHLVGWSGDDPFIYQEATDPVFCGKVAVSRYPAMGGGYMHLCLEHGRKHRDISEPCYAGERA